MDLKKRIKEIGYVIGKGYQGDQIYDIEGIAPTLSSQAGNSSKGSLLVFMPTTLTNTPAKSTEKTSETKNLSKEISEPYQQSLFQITTYSLRDFLASLSVLLENEKDLEILVELSSLKYAELWKRRNLIFFSLKTSKGYLITMGGTRSELSSIAFQNWGMTVNGKCLTARISESRRTGKECSLSDILEEQVDKKYFLSEKAIRGLMKGQTKPQILEHYKEEDIQGGTIQE